VLLEARDEEGLMLKSVKNGVGLTCPKGISPLKDNSPLRVHDIEPPRGLS